MAARKISARFSELVGMTECVRLATRQSVIKSSPTQAFYCG
jgi:hypothetical protein